MGRECREFFPQHAGKGSLLSSYEAESGILWMWEGLSCFLSSGVGYVGELLEVHKGVKDPLEFPEGPLKSEHALRMSASFLKTLSRAGFLTKASGRRSPQERREELQGRATIP